MRKRILFDLIIIVLLGTLPILWLKDGSVLLGHDAGLALDPIMHFSDRLYVWSQRFSIGTDQSAALLGAFFIHGFEAMLAWLGFSLHWGQIVQFIFWFTMPGLTMYFFAYKIWSEKKYLPLIASVIYMLNFYLIQGWFIAERTKFSIYVALPLVLYFLITYLTGKTGLLRSVLFSGITLGLFNGGGSFPLYGGLIFAILTIFFYINFIRGGIDTFKRTVFYSLGTGIIYLLLNAYWITTYFFYLSGFYSRDLATAGGTEGALAWAKYLSAQSTFINIFRGQGIPDWYLNPFHAFASNFLNNPALILASFLFPIFAFSSLLLIRKRKDRFYIYLFVLIALVGILFSSGSGSELNVVYESMVKYIPGFAIFRSAFFKFNYIVWFSYGLLIGFSLDSLFTRLETSYFKKYAFLFSKIILIAFVIGYTLYHYPVLTGSFLDYSREPGKELTTRVKVPEYVLDFGKWVNTQDPNKRFLVMPQLKEDTNYISYQWKYWSIAPVTSLLTRSSFVHNSALATQTEKLLMNKMYSSFIHGDMESFRDLADVFAIDGVLLQKDYDWKNISWGTINPAVYENILDSDPLFSLEKTFGQWKVYSLTDRKKSLRINSTTRLSFLQGDLGKVASFPYLDARAPLFLSDLEKRNIDYFANSATQLFLAPECIQCDLEYKEGTFKYYNPRVLPGSFLYPIITLKENLVKNKSNDFNSILNFYITTSDRRIIEVKWMSDSRKRIQEIPSTLQRYNESLVQLKIHLSKEEWTSSAKEENKMAQLVMNHIVQQVNLIDSIYDNEITGFTNRQLLGQAYNEILEIQKLTNNKLWVTEDAINKKYIFDLPITGNYEVFVKKGSLTNPQQDTSGTQISIKDSKTLKPNGEIEDWLSFGSVNLGDKKTLLTLKDSTLNNLLDNASLVFPDGKNGITSENNNFSLSSDGLNKCFYYQLEGLGILGTQYLISFKYRNFSDIHSLSFFTKSEGEPFYQYNIKDSAIERSRFFKNYTKLLTPGNPQMRLYFCNGFVSIGEANVIKEKGEIELLPEGQILTQIRDIEFHKVSFPNIVLYKEQRGASDENLVVDFTKKDPVTYEINLNDVNKPASLIMRESFGKYWQVCSRNKCLPFDDKSHFSSAGFTNAWYFEKGMGKKLRLYYYPQKMFIVGVVITIVASIVIIGGTCLLILKRK